MLSIVCPVLNCHPVVETMTIDQADAVFKNTLGDWELIHVVHGPRDLSLRIDFPRFKKVYIPEQVSVARALNEGFDIASGDTFCCMHNDVVVPFAWNYLLDRVANRGEIAFPFVDETTGYCEQRGVPKTEVWQPSSACFMFAREIYEKLGGFDEQFEEMHGEDFDFFKRAQDAGIKLTRCDVKVIHYRGATRTLVPDKGNKSFVDNWNKYYFKHKSGAGKDVPLPRISVEAEEKLEI